MQPSMLIERLTLFIEKLYFCEKLYKPHNKDIPTIIMDLRIHFMSVNQTHVDQMYFLPTSLCDFIFINSQK